MNRKGHLVKILHFPDEKTEAWDLNHGFLRNPQAFQRRESRNHHKKKASSPAEIHTILYNEAIEINTGKCQEHYLYILNNNSYLGLRGEYTHHKQLDLLDYQMPRELA